MAHSRQRLETGAWRRPLTIGSKQQPAPQLIEALGPVTPITLLRISWLRQRLRARSALELPEHNAQSAFRERRRRAEAGEPEEDGRQVGGTGRSASQARRCARSPPIAADLERTREALTVLTDSEQFEAELAAARADTQAEVSHAAQQEAAARRERMQADEAAAATTEEQSPRVLDLRRSIERRACAQHPGARIDSRPAGRGDEWRLRCDGGNRRVGL